ncbi:MAG: hypothetical protein ABH971_00545, partial [bacterium]
SYHIVVNKNNYSNDQTYPITVQNPNPIKPDSTISNGQITQISFSIDKLSNLSLWTLNQYCNPIPEIDIKVQGSKLIGTIPSILKFNNLYTSNFDGEISLQNIEWDNYTPILNDPNFTIYGTSPIQQVNLFPNTKQNFTFILGPKTDNNLLVIVKDSSTNNLIEGAEVEISSVIRNFNAHKFTGGSLWDQKSWIGGNGQANWTDPTKYFEGFNISANEIPEALRLLSYDEGLTYMPSGYIISSSFDTGISSTTFTNIDWQPTSQNPATSVKFQIAINNDNMTWNFVGPDGTSNTFYTIPGTNINNNFARYIRYKIFLETSDTAITPVITSVNINYISGCFTPGQVIFTNLETANDYEVKIKKDGYIDQIISNLEIVQENPNLQILLNQ